MGYVFCFVWPLWKLASLLIFSSTEPSGDPCSVSAAVFPLVILANNTRKQKKSYTFDIRFMTKESEGRIRLRGGGEMRETYKFVYDNHKWPGGVRGYKLIQCNTK